MPARNLLAVTFAASCVLLSSSKFAARSTLDSLRVVSTRFGDAERGPFGEPSRSRPQANTQIANVPRIGHPRPNPFTDFIIPYLHLGTRIPVSRIHEAAYVGASRGAKPRPEHTIATSRIFSQQTATSRQEQTPIRPRSKQPNSSNDSAGSTDSKKTANLTRRQNADDQAAPNSPRQNNSATGAIPTFGENPRVSRAPRPRSTPRARRDRPAKQDPANRGGERVYTQTRSAVR